MPRPWRSLAVVTALAAWAVTGPMSMARAQPVDTTTSTTTPPSPTTKTPAVEPPGPPAAEPLDSVPESVPTQPVAIPPPAPPPPGAVGPAAPLPPPALQKLNRAVDGAAALRSVALRRVEALQTEVLLLERRLAGLDADHKDRTNRLVDAKLRLKRLAVARYVATPVAPLNSALDAPDLTDLTRRVAILGVVSDADRGRISEYETAKREVSGTIERLVADLERARASLAAAKAALDKNDATLVAAQAQLVAAQAGVPLATGGLVFPVFGSYTFTDSFGAPRMFGTPYAHLHQGTDVFAPTGTPLVAIERGVLVNVGTDVLGGTKLWLAGASGTKYFYAHLLAFAPGVVEGKPVQPGELVGFVGNTGNARGTASHLHFEVHPGGGPAINPYPLLRIIDEAQQEVAAQRGRPAR